MKTVVSQDTCQTIAPHLNITMRVEVAFQSLLMVLHSLRLEWEKSMELTASSHRSCFLSLSGEKAALSESVPTGARRKER